MGVSTALDTKGSQGDSLSELTANVTNCVVRSGFALRCAAHGEGNPNAVISCCVSAISVLSLLCIPVAVAMLTADSVSQAIFQQSPQSGEVLFASAVLSPLTCCVNLTAAAVSGNILQRTAARLAAFGVEYSNSEGAFATQHSS